MLPMPYWHLSPAPCLPGVKEPESVYNYFSWSVYPAQSFPVETSWRPDCLRFRQCVYSFSDGYVLHLTQCLLFQPTSSRTDLKNPRTAGWLSDANAPP